MKHFIKLSLLLFILLTSSYLHGQKVISGVVLDENFDVALGCSIYANDTVFIAYVDIDGTFKVQLEEEYHRLSFHWAGYETTKIEITDQCDHLEVIIMSGGCYLGMSDRKIDRIRRRRFENLTALHKYAIEAGYFKATPCYKRIFQSK